MMCSVCDHLAGRTGDATPYPPFRYSAHGRPRIGICDIRMMTTSCRDGIAVGRRYRVHARVTR